MDERVPVFRRYIFYLTLVVMGSVRKDVYIRPIVWELLYETFIKKN